MVHPYSEMFLDDATRCLGDAFNYATNFLNESLELFYAAFVDSSYSTRFEKGDYSVIAGLTGAELAKKVLRQAGKIYVNDNTSFVDYTFPEEYWIGWILAYYQWVSGRFNESVLRCKYFKRISKSFGIFPGRFGKDMLYEPSKSSAI